MFSHEKMRTLNQGRSRQLPRRSPSKSARANIVNNRAKPHPLGAEDGSLPLALFNKVRNYRSAAQVRALGLYPYFRTISSAQDTEVIIEGKKVLMLGSNSYLGLTNHPKIKEAAKAAVEKYGTGCAGSRFLNGTLDIHLELEEALARLVNKEAVLLYSTGFQVNLGVISALVGKGEYVLADKATTPASSRAVCSPTASSCASRTRTWPPWKAASRKSTRGRANSSSWTACSAWRATSSSCRNSAASPANTARPSWWMTPTPSACLGKNGAGTASHFGLTDQVHLIMGTFSKSLASLGGFIASDAETIDYLKHHSRPLIFSASMSPANAAAVLAALQIMRAEPERIAQLWRNTERMKQGLLSLGFDLGDSETPILPVYCRDMMVAFKFCKRLQEEGVFVNPVVSPAVAPGQELIRISLMATHTDSQIDFALEKLGKVGRELGLP